MDTNTGMERGAQRPPSVCRRGDAYQRRLVPSWWWAVSRMNSRAAHPSSPPRNTKSRARLSLNPDREKEERERVNIAYS